VPRFPAKLRKLGLVFTYCPLSDDGVPKLIAALPAQLEDLTLRLVGCEEVTVAGSVLPLATGLPAGLQRLALHVRWCPKIQAEEACEALQVLKGEMAVELDVDDGRLDMSDPMLSKKWAA